MVKDSESLNEEQMLNLSRWRLILGKKAEEQGIHFTQFTSSQGAGACRQSGSSGVKAGSKSKGAGKSNSTKGAGIANAVLPGSMC